MAELLRMPEVAANTPEAVLDSWNVAVDTAYAAGDPIVTVETEKAVVDVEAESDGVLLRLLVDPGTTVAVGTPIAVWGTKDESPEAVETLLATLGVAPAEVTADGPSVAVDAPPAAATALVEPPAGGIALRGVGERIFASPLARRLARELGVELGAIVGTGPNGRIRRPDVEAAAARPATTEAVEPSPAQAAQVPAAQVSAEPTSGAAAVTAYTEVPNSRMRVAIARRLSESKQTIPHFYLRASARVDGLLALRGQLNAEQTVKLSINDLLVKAVGRAHAEVPTMNVQWNETSIRHFSAADVAIAVATEGGLVTPVVRGVDTLSMSGVAAATKDLIARAKERRLRQDELEGGSITITNLGMYGTEDFAAIINPPQAAILAVGAIRQEAVVEDGAVGVASVLRMTLAVDHRPVDGATAAEWLRAFVDLLEHPIRILL